MNMNEELFLMLSEELNFSKTAQKAFITQQCLSTHIKRLEEAYDKKLLVRKPKVALTPAGELVRDTLLAIRQLETGMQEKLSEMENGQRGAMHIGMNATRAELIIPRLFSIYHRNFPDVKLHILTDETVRLAEALEKGELDCILGVNSIFSNKFKNTRLSSESLSLVISNAFLDKRPQIRESLKQCSRPNIRLFDGCTMITDSDVSTTYQLISRLCADNNTDFKRILSIESYNISEEICRQEDIGFFCPDIALNKILKNNSNYPESKRLRAISVAGLKDVITFSLIIFKNRQFPRYALELFKCIHQVTDELLRIDTYTQ